MPIRIVDVKQKVNGQFNELSATVSHAGERKDISFSRFGSDPAVLESQPSFDPFLPLLLLPAMKLGEAIEVEGEVDSLLLYRCQTELQDVAISRVAGLKRIKVSASPRHSSLSSPASHVATGFSGGVDSMHLLNASLFEKSLPDVMRVSMIVHNEIGSVKDAQQYENNLKHTKYWAERLGVEWASARCNVEDLYDGLSFSKTHHFRNAAAALSLSHLHRSYVYCSSLDTLTSSKIIKATNLNCVEGQLLPLFDTTSNRFYSFGSTATRIEKIKAVLSNGNLLEGLNVCARPNHDNTRFLNCGRCFKCFPFLIVVKGFGHLDRLAQSFDLDAFNCLQSRCMLNLFLRGVRSEGNQFVRHTFNYLRQSKGVSPWWAKMLAALVPPPLVQLDPEVLSTPISPLTQRPRPNSASTKSEISD
ncbi:MAG: hypothetical protein ACON4H_03025 [Rubripirellula sp.]